MRPIVLITVLGASSCIPIDDDPCEAPAEEVFNTAVLGRTSGQAYLNTPAAAKGCHAVFTAQLKYTGGDAFDRSLPRPAVAVSASAIGTGGEQPGVVGILSNWGLVEDPDSGEISWWAEIDAAAKNIDAPAVSYGMAGVRQPAELRDVEYYAQITYRPPSTDASARLAPGVRGTCR